MGVEGRVEHRAEWRRDDDRQALRAAPRHDRVDRGRSAGDRAVATADRADDVIGLEADGAEHHEEIFERLRGDRLAADVLRAGDLTDDLAAARRRVEERNVAVMSRAAGVGAVRDDVTYEDMSVLVLGTAHRLSELGVTDRAAWQRMAGFVLAAVAP